MRYVSDFMAVTDCLFLYIVELKDKSRWTTVKGNYINVSVFSTAGRSNLSPLGMSKFTHLADGCIDLALVHSVDRKQFLRFLRRHGKKKNQVS